MSESGMTEKIPQRYAEGMLVQILRWRGEVAADAQRSKKPTEVNEHLSFFPNVSLREGYMLDYVEEGGGVAGWIRPFAKPTADTLVTRVSPGMPPPFERLSLLGLKDRTEPADDEVERLYQYLDYERSAEGVFEYAFFLLELGAVHADWHAAEWLDSRPVFTKRRFDRFVARRQAGTTVPEHYGPWAVVKGDGGVTRFMVHTPVCHDCIYELVCEVEADGRVSMSRGSIVADMGPGFVY